MKSCVSLCVAAITAILVCGVASPYGVETHESLSRAAAHASRALGEGPGSIFPDLALPRNARFPGSEENLQSVIGLIGFGAVHEDKLPLLRMRNHFFDPQNGGRGLTIGAEIGFPSPDWTLEDRGPLPDRFPLMFPQEFSLADGLNYYMDALTLSDEDSRRRKFGLVFQTLGHAIHHVQDMAQFEHVRNDQHISGADTSYYEKWTNQNLRALPLGGYPAIDLGRFRTARSFWMNDGKGMAEFVSHNFVSKDTNFTGRPGSFGMSPGYPLPAIGSSPPIEKVTLAALLGSSWAPMPDAQVWFIGTLVSDANEPARSRFNSRSSTFSIFSQDLSLRPTPSLFTAATTLNRFNFAAAQEFLIPRAVAYSAGLIDYFFRGRLALDSFESSDGRITVSVRNVSAADFALGERTDGGLEEFSLYYDAQDGSRQRLPLGGDDLAGVTLPVGATRTLHFPLPDNLADDREKPFMLVFDGVIGEERGIAALALPAPAHGGFVVHPDYLPADGIAAPRHVVFTGGQWMATGRTGQRAGNVDWRGDQPGEVLTWDGPPSRYFYPADRRGGYSPHIYRNGRVLADAPGLVQGAALYSDAAGQWLAVVVYIDGQLRLYVRPEKGIYDNHELHDAVSNPDGWRLLFAQALELPATPMFFSASGAEAQTIVGPLSGNAYATRVKLSMNSGALTVETSSAIGAGRLTGRTDFNADWARTVAEGVQQPDSCAVTYRCLANGKCKDIGGLERTICIHQKIDHADHRRETEAALHGRIEWDRPTVVCADYRGETEVLCVVEADPAWGADWVRDWFYDRRGELVQTGDSCGLVPSETRQRRYQASRTSFNSTLRRLRVGTASIPLRGARTDEQRDDSTVIAQPANGPEASGAVGVTSTTVGSSTRLFYADARNDMLVYELNEEITTRTASASGVPGYGQGPTYPLEWMSEWQIATHTVTRGEAVIGGLTHVMYEQSGQIQEQTSPVKLSISAGSFLEPLNCRPFEPYTVSSSEQPYVDTFTGMAASLHPGARSWPAVTQGYAIDRAGRVLASQTRWVRRTDGTYLPDGVWNFLGEGDLVRVLPAGGQESAFFPVGVID